MQNQNKSAHPPWEKDVRKALIDHGLNLTMLAEELGCTRVYLSYIVNGARRSKTLEKKIFDRLGINIDKTKHN